MSAIATPLPAPVGGQEDVPSSLIAALKAHRDVLGAEWVDRTIAMVEERSAFGLRKYGQTLKTFDGRPPHLDALQELVDLFQYLHKSEMQHAALEAQVADLTAALEAARAAAAGPQPVVAGAGEGAVPAAADDLASPAGLPGGPDVPGADDVPRAAAAALSDNEERSACDAVASVQCAARPRCWVSAGVRCPAYPKANRGRRA